MTTNIDARAVWLGEIAECRKLYRQFKNVFHGNFYAINRHYGWKKASMLKALRNGSK